MAALSSREGCRVDEEVTGLIVKSTKGQLEVN